MRPCASMVGLRRATRVGVSRSIHFSIPEVFSAAASLQSATCLAVTVLTCGRPVPTGVPQVSRAPRGASTGPGEPGAEAGAADRTGARVERPATFRMPQIPLNDLSLMIGQYSACCYCGMCAADACGSGKSTSTMLQRCFSRQSYIRLVIATGGRLLQWQVHADDAAAVAVARVVISSLTAPL